jgi:hypothetical protein
MFPAKTRLFHSLCFYLLPNQRPLTVFTKQHFHKKIAAIPCPQLDRQRTGKKIGQHSFPVERVVSLIETIVASWLELLSAKPE